MCIQTTFNDTIYGEHLKINNCLQILTGYIKLATFNMHTCQVSHICVIFMQKAKCHVVTHDIKMSRISEFQM